jgi:uncharacterized caspase-like protein
MKARTVAWGAAVLIAVIGLNGRAVRLVQGAAPGDGAGDERVGRLWGVVVGVGNYSGPKGAKGRFEDFPGAARAAGLMKAAVEENFLHAGQPDVALLTDDGDPAQRGRTLPTVTNVLNALHTRVRAAEPDDTIVFYFTGHGEQGLFQDQVLLATGAVFGRVGDEIPLSSIKLLMDGARAKRKLVFLDTCRVNPPAELTLGRIRPKNDAFSEMASKASVAWKNTALFFSSSSGKPSRVNAAADVGYGYFTQQLLQGLGGEADLQGEASDLRLHLLELAMYLKKSVPDVTSRRDDQGEPRDEEQMPVVMFESNEDYVIARYASPVVAKTPKEVRRRRALRPPGLELAIASPEAKVFIDGEFRGYTPFAISLEGKHRVKLTADWYLDREFDVTIGGQELSSPPVSLVRGQGTIMLDQDMPRETVITENGAAIKLVNGRATLPAGPHTLILQKREYLPHTWHGDVGIQQTVIIKSSLESRPVALHFKPPLPADAEVYVEGRRLTGAPNDWTVKVGDRLHVAISAEGFRDFATVLPEKGKKATVEWKMKRGPSVMVSVPPGSFTRTRSPAPDPFVLKVPVVPGGLSELAGTGPKSTPGREKKYPAFRIDRRPVSESEYHACVERGACLPARESSSLASDGPQYNVSFTDALAYCKQLGRRLPWSYELLALQKRAWIERWPDQGTHLVIAGLQDFRQAIVGMAQGREPAATEMIEIAPAETKRWGEWANSRFFEVEVRDEDRAVDVPIADPVNDIPVQSETGLQVDSSKNVGQSRGITHHDQRDSFPGVGFRCAL